MLFCTYTLVTLAFFPLFLSIINRFRIAYPEVYPSIKAKLQAIFVIFNVFLTTRLYLYADLKSLHVLFPSPTIYSLIPFYLTEIIVAVSLSYVLYITG